jgi:hypothetical protein
MGDAMKDQERVSVTFRAAEIIAGLLPSRQEHLSNEAKRAVIEFLGQVLRTKTRIAGERETDPDT